LTHDTRDGRPLPNVGPVSGPFWEGLRQNELRLQRCASCGHYNHPPKLQCPRCHAETLEWVAVPPRGRIYTYTIVYRAPLPVFKDKVPYAVGVVEIDGTAGLRLLSNIDGPLESIEIGVPVELMFEPVTDDFSLFRFRLAAIGAARQATA
jgi:uncharacterized OB-fold protein